MQLINCIVTMLWSITQKKATLAAYLQKSGVVLFLRRHRLDIQHAIKSSALVKLSNSNYDSKMNDTNTLHADEKPFQLVNPSVLRLDGHQIKARRHNFSYNEAIENQRRFVALYVDYLLLIEKRTLEFNGNNQEQIQFPNVGSSLDISLGFFASSLSKMHDIEVLMKDRSFNQHLASLTCFNWEFYFLHLHRNAHRDTSPTGKNDREWRLMKQRSVQETLDDLQPISQVVFSTDDNFKCDLWNYFQSERSSLKEPK